jgi:ribosomal protein S18 acetylase RimI-like enzyme
MSMKICAFHYDYASEAAALFVQSYQKQRLATPILPGKMEDPAQVSAMLGRLVRDCPGVIALEGDRLVGYMGWLFVDRFRGTDRKGAYVPEWGHACVEDGKAKIERALYRAAAQHWAAAGCQVHAISLLAHDHVAEKVWFWNGFGLTVVDAVRPMCPLNVPYSTGLHIRKATSDDAQALAELDVEHWTHYARSPIFMPSQAGQDAAEHVAFLSRPKNSIWLALDGDVPVGFMRYEGYDFDGVAIVESDDAVSITGAYVRPAYRGRRLAVALLDAALRDYQARGLTFCAVNFESFNPEAAAFWMQYFEPVCLSLVRVPEALGTQKGHMRM